MFGLSLLFQTSIVAWGEALLNFFACCFSRWRANQRRLDQVEVLGKAEQIFPCLQTTADLELFAREIFSTAMVCTTRHGRVCLDLMEREGKHCTKYDYTGTMDGQ